MELIPTQSGSAGPAAHGTHAQARDCDPACCGGDLWGENRESGKGLESTAKFPLTEAFRASQQRKYSPFKAETIEVEVRNTL